MKLYTIASELGVDFKELIEGVLRLRRGNLTRSGYSLVPLLVELKVLVLVPSARGCFVITLMLSVVSSP